MKSRFLSYGINGSGNGALVCTDRFAFIPPRSNALKT
jgi:hypothetical protein